MGGRSTRNPVAPTCARRYHDLVARALDAPTALSCDTLGPYHRPDARLGRVLRLAHDPAGQRLLLTAEERREQDKEAALLRVAELEAELGRR
jgi:hypothetical protein